MAIYGLGMSTDEAVKKRYFPFCRHLWLEKEDGTPLLLQLLLGNKVIAEEGVSTQFSLLFLNNTAHPRMSMNLSGDYKCIFSSNPSTESPPFTVIILGKRYLSVQLATAVAQCVATHTNRQTW